MLETILDWKWSAKGTLDIRYWKDGLTIKDKLEEEDVCNGELIPNVLCIVKVYIQYSRLPKIALIFLFPILG